MSSAACTASLRAITSSRSVGTLESVELPPGSFDLVVTFHAVEHLTDPRSSISAVAHVLRSKGRVLIVTPCCDAVVVELVGPTWFQDADHVAFYSRRTLHRLLSYGGFTVLKSESWIGTVWGGESGPGAPFCGTRYDRAGSCVNVSSCRTRVIL